MNDDDEDDSSMAEETKAEGESKEEVDNEEEKEKVEDEGKEETEDEEKEETEANATEEPKVKSEEEEKEPEEEPKDDSKESTDISTVVLDTPKVNNDTNVEDYSGKPLETICVKDYPMCFKLTEETAMAFTKDIAKYGVEERSS